MKNIFVSWLLLCPALSAHAEWKEIGKGFFLSEENLDGVSVTAVRVRQDDARVKVVSTAEALENTDYAGRYTLDSVIALSKPLVAINGGFSKHKELPVPLSALVVDRKTVSKPNLETTTYQWVICSDGKHTRIGKVDEIPTESCTFAIQAGPGLIQKHELTDLAATKASLEQASQRSAVCLDGESQLLLIQTSAVTFGSLQKIIAQAPYNCVEAFALSGGYQSGLFVNDNQQEKRSGTTTAVIPSAIVILP